MFSQTAIFHIERIGDLIRCQSFEHQSDQTKIDVARRISQSYLKALGQDFTSLHTRI
jgi:hypothetical protein